VIARLFALLMTAAVVTACTAATAPSPSPAASASAKAQTARVFVLSNSQPNVTMIDGETNKILKTVNIPGFKSWTWNDDNNYQDGKDIWLGHRDPATNDAEVVLLNLETLEIDDRIPLGKEATTLYIGKPRDGILFVAKHASWQLVPIDVKTHKTRKLIAVDVNAGTTGKAPQWAACDSDTSVGADGVTRIYVPTSFGTTTVAIDAATGKQLKSFASPPGSRPCMLTTAPDGTVWVQECDGNADIILDPVTLELLKRVPSGKAPVVAAFTADGRYGLIGHAGDTIVQVIDAKTFAEVKRIEVGTNPDKVASHPNGKWLYAEINKEGAVAVIDTSTWTVKERIVLGTNPTGIFVQARP
jgi:DNA-binding beta-propeller fold protein YncE